MVPGAGAGCPVPLLARTAELRGPAHLLPRAKGRATFRGFGGYFGGANKRCTHWWLKRSVFFVVAPKFIFNGGGSKDPTQDWWLK